MWQGLGGLCATLLCGHQAIRQTLVRVVACGGVHVAAAMQVDGALLGHPDVAEAVSFGAPDEKYGEVVAAAVVPVRPVQDVPAFVKAVQQHAATKLAKFKVRVVPELCACCACSSPQHLASLQHMVHAAQGRRHAWPDLMHGPV